ncbi:amino acid ABC transporter permease [Sphaerimonospora cavernae]|uniref:Amino acid ABC transporter permease n=1 Tax=Sphaerimonospora cavernae TaxID=1740611 RepID=A0ABV6U1K8_9ACTN
MTAHLVVAPNIDWQLLFDRIFNGSPVFWHSLAATVYISISAQLVGIILGVLTVGAVRSRIPPLRALAWLYRLVMRGTPPIVQIFFIYYGANLLLGFDLFPANLSVGSITISGALIAGITALGLIEGAYMSEIIRGGLESVEDGQLEAALAVGMTRRKAMWRIIAPQAARVIIPTVGNQYNYMLKATSLLSFIGVNEMFQDAQMGYAATFQPVEYFIGVAIWYLVLTSLWGAIQTRIERRLGASESETIGERPLWKPWKKNLNALVRRNRETEKAGA